MLFNSNLKENKHIIILFLILILAFTVRVYGLANESLWFDEAFSVYHAQQSLNHIVELNDPTPPLHLTILHDFINIFGNNEFWVRFPSVIFGTLSVLLIYMISTKLFDRRVGIFASVILALSSYHVFYSQEARVYELLSFLALLSMYFFITRVRENKSIIPYWISTIFLIYSHFFGLLVVLVQNIFLFYEKKINRKWILSQLVLLVFYIPGLLLLINQFVSVSDDFWIPQEFILEVIFIPYVFSGGFVLHALYSLLFLFGIYYFLKNYNKSKKTKKDFVLLLMFLTMPILIPLLYSLFKPIFLIKYVIYTSIPIYIIVALAITKLKIKYQYIILALIIIASFYYIGIQSTDFNKEPWREISGYVSTLQADNIIIDPGYMALPFVYYHDPSCFSDENIYDCIAERRIYTIWGNENDIEFSNISSFIYISKTSEYQQDESQIREFIENNYEKTSTKSFRGDKYSNITVSVLRKS